MGNFVLGLRKVPFGFRSTDSKLALKRQLFLGIASNPMGACFTPHPEPTCSGGF